MINKKALSTQAEEAWPCLAIDPVLHGDQEKEEHHLTKLTGDTGTWECLAVG